MMRSHFFTAAKIKAMFQALPAQVEIHTDQTTVWIVAQK
jgi:hypothetical protein